MKELLDRRFCNVALLLVVLTLAAYWPVFDAQFVNYDDKDYVFENAVVLSGWSWSGVKWAFTTGLMGNWHPLTWLSHLTDVELFGIDPVGHHATSLVLHLANVVLAFALFRELTSVLWASAIAAAVFGLHPLRVESVAWVAERKDVLSAFFGLLTLLLYVRYARSRPLAVSATVLHGLKSPTYWLTFTCLVLGLLSKPMLVTWPVLFLVLDVWPLQRVSRATMRPLLLEKIPFILLGAGIACITWQTQQHSEAVISLQDFSLPARFANSLHSIFVYLQQFFWPVGLAMFYPLQPWPIAKLLLAVTVLIGLSAFAIRWRHKQPWFTFGWAWYLIVLSPVCGLTQAGLQAHADRYTYLPSLGWSLALIWPLAAWLTPVITARLARIAIVVVPLLVLSGMTYRQACVWQNSETLFRHAIAVTHGNFMAHQGLGEELAHVGKEAEAKTEFITALELYPRLPSARNNLAVILLREGQFAAAVAAFRQVLAERPDLLLAHFNLAQAYEGLHDYASALPEYETFLTQRPEDFEAQLGLARCFSQTGQTDAAIERLRSLQAANPLEPRLCLLLATQYQFIGQFRAAVTAYETAIALSPQSPELHNNLAWLLAVCSETSIQNGDRAIQLALRANELTGFRQPMLMGTLAAAYAEAGRFDEAVATAQQAIDLAKAAGQTELAARNAELQKLYRARQPYHEPAP